MNTVTLPADEVIFREKDLSTETYRLLSGTVEISILVEGTKVVLAQLAAGDIFGEMAMIDEHPRSATATTLDESEIEVMTPEDFNHCILEDPATLKPYLASFFERLRNTNNRLRLELRHKKPTDGSVSIERIRSTVALPRRDQFSRSQPVMTSQCRITLRPIDPQSPDVQQPEILIKKYPFRIGREENRSVPSVFSSNDYVLHDEKPYQLSRNHCSIECEGPHIFIRDRGSMVGTIVNGVSIGADAGTLIADLQPGENTLVLGADSSPFKFIVEMSNS